MNRTFVRFVHLICNHELVKDLILFVFILVNITEYDTDHSHSFITWSIVMCLCQKFHFEVTLIDEWVIGATCVFRLFINDVISYFSLSRMRILRVTTTPCTNTSMKIRVSIIKRWVHIFPNKIYVGYIQQSNTHLR